jgi:hypothetical protein
MVYAGCYAPNSTKTRYIIIFIDMIYETMRYRNKFYRECCKQLQQFGEPTWHPYNFGKIRKIGLQQFGKPTWQK